ncbi:MAG: hypothetical protein PSW75_06900, partial [bacterium]|nr:hypothetical protein [bacterium]
MLHSLRSGRWLTAEDGEKPDANVAALRARSRATLERILVGAQTQLAELRGQWMVLQKAGQGEGDAAKAIQERMTGVMHLVDGAGMQLYFACGADEERSNKKERHLNSEQLVHFWQDA